MKRTKAQPSQVRPEGPPEPGAAPQAASELVALHFAGAALTPAQQRFNRLLKRIDTLSGKLQALITLADGHRVAYVNTLDPLERQQQDLMRRMALYLHGRLQQPGLSAAQKQVATEIVCYLSEALAMEGDAEMQALHDALSPDSLEDKSRDAADELQSMLEALLGVSLDEDGADPTPRTPEEVLRAGMEQVRAEQARLQEARAARPNARQRKAAQQSADAQSALRTVYRQLASALHPDRETDPAEHTRKTALMSEVNAAYERRDLTALLQLALRVEQVDAGSVARMAQEKIVALTQLLKEQVAALEQDVWRMEQRLREEFTGSPHGHLTLTAASLKRALREQQQDLQMQIAQMERELALVQNDARLKRWLKEQKAMSQSPGPLGDLDFF